MGEEEKPNDLCAMERGGPGDAKAGNGELTLSINRATKKQKCRCAMWAFSEKAQPMNASLCNLAQEGERDPQSGDHSQLACPAVLTSHHWPVCSPLSSFAVDVQPQDWPALRQVMIFLCLFDFGPRFMSFGTYLSRKEVTAGAGRAGATAVSKYVMASREREADQFVRYEERQNRTLFPCCLRPCRRPTQPMLPLRALSGSTALQQQGSVSTSVAHPPPFGQPGAL